jgi:hypothetical protein
MPRAYIPCRLQKKWLGFAALKIPKLCSPIRYAVVSSEPPTTRTMRSALAPPWSRQEGIIKIPFFYAQPPFDVRSGVLLLGISAGSGSLSCRLAVFYLCLRLIGPGPIENS